MASNIQVVGVRFEDENAEYLKKMKKKTGISKNKLVNLIIANHIQEHGGDIPEVRFVLVKKES